MSERLVGEELITRIYNQFHPDQALEAGDKRYVDCRNVRGQANIFNEVGRKILRSDLPTCQLYTGHRGVGKTTELRRLKAYLEEKGCFVVYFPATDSDIDSQDAQYTDILLACARHILEDLETLADTKPLIQWLSSRWEKLTDILGHDARIDNSNLDLGIGDFAKLTANLRLAPGTRQRIRAEVEAHTRTLTRALNNFIEEAQQNLPPGKTKLVVIADNLDRIAPMQHEDIFIDRCLQLRALQCHAVYTVPISLVYSDRATEIRDSYDSLQILPMIVVRSRQEEPYEDGLLKLSQIIQKRVDRVQTGLVLDGDVFDGAATRRRLCEMSGGHMRELMLLMQTAMDWTDTLPISSKAVQRAISRFRNDIYRSTVDAEDWSKLAAVAISKSLPNDDEYRELLFRCCLLEYRETHLNDEDEEEIKYWYDVHPLFYRTPEFREALQNYRLFHDEIFSLDADAKIAHELAKIQEEYNQLLAHASYQEAAKIAGNAYKLLENYLEFLDRSRDRDAYQRASALAAYWKLSRDLYLSR